MASRRNVVTFLTAPARSGKSFNEVRRIVDEILPDEQGPIYTNLPLKVDRIAAYCGERHGMDEDQVSDRIHIIPREVELRWQQAGQPIYDEDTGRKVGKEELAGPWTYFAEKPLSGATIIIDEIHNFCGTVGTPKPVRDQWQKWLGELGHNQAIFRCLSQAPEKVAPSIKNEASAHYTIRNTGLDCDPYFGIEIYDWLELWAGLFGGDFKVFVFEQETKKVEGKKVKGKRKLHRMGPPYFDFYDSFNAPIAHAQAEDVKPFEHEYERRLKKGPIRGRVSLLLWFVAKYLYELVSRFFILFALVLLFWALVTGALTAWLTGQITSMTTPAHSSIQGDSAPGPGRRGLPRSSGRPAPAAVSSTTADTTSESQDKPGETTNATADILALEKKLQALKAEKEALEDQLIKAQDLVLIHGQTITLRGGFTYAIGDTVDTGPHEGKVLEAIDWERRTVTFADGSSLHLGY